MIVGRFLDRVAERRAYGSVNFAPYGDGRIPPNSLADMVDSPAGRVSDAQALRYLAVYGSVSLLADVVAMLPFIGYKDVDEVRKKVPDQPRLLTQPYADLDVFDWWQCAMSSLLLRGNAYNLVAEVDRLGYPQQLMPVHPDDVTNVYRDKKTCRPTYDIRTPDGDIKPHLQFPFGDVVHVRGLTIAGSLEGLSPIGYASEVIRLGLDATSFGAKWFRDGAQPSGTLESDQDLNEKQTRQAMRSWIRTHGGRRLPAVLSNGFKWKPISISPNESQFLETRGFTAAEVAGMLYRVPPHMIGLQSKSTSWGTGVEEQTLGFITFAAMPWVSRWESKLTSLLPSGQYTAVDPEELVKGRLLDRLNAMMIERQIGIASANELRARFGRGPIPEGDTFMQPLYWGPLGTTPPGYVDPVTGEVAGERHKEEEDDE